MPRGNKKNGSDLGYRMLTFLFLLLLAAVAVLLLFPAYRDYRAKRNEEVKLEKELDGLRRERDERLKVVNELQSSPAAVEKVARERFNLVRPGETVLTYPVAGEKKE